MPLEFTSFAHRERQIVRASEVLTKLTALESLVILWDKKLRRDCHDKQQTPLPAGMHALRGLLELRVTCYTQRMRPLALPSLELLQLDDAPSATSELRHALQSSSTLATVSVSAAALAA